MIDFPLEDFEVSGSCSTEETKAIRTELVVAVVETLGEVCAALFIIQTFIRYLKIGISKRRAKGFATPDSLVFVDERISLVFCETKKESLLGCICMPLTFRTPR